MPTFTEAKAGMPSAVLDVHPTIVDTVKSEVKTDLIGEDPPVGYKRFFYNIDQFSGEQNIRAPKSYNIINAYFTFAYYIIMIAFAIYAGLQFTNQVPVEMNTMVKSLDINPIAINITMSCSLQYGCGNWSLTPDSLIDPIQIIYNWAQDTGSSCHKQYPTITVASLPATLGPYQSFSVLFDVCYSPRVSDFVQVLVPYTNGYRNTFPKYNIKINGSTSMYNNDMYFEVPLQPLEWKTVYLSQTKYVNTKLEERYEPFIGDLFYNGHSTENSFAKLTFKVQQFSYQSTQSNQITLFGTFGTIGGFSWTCSSFLGSIKNIGLGVFNFAKTFKESSGTLGFFTMLFVFIMKAFGQVA